MNESKDSGDGEALDEKTADPDPLKQFQRWFDEARAKVSQLPEAMTLATSSSGSIPSARLVLLKQVDEEGFVFYTNYRSRKARDLDANPFAAEALRRGLIINCTHDFTLRLLPPFIITRAQVREFLRLFTLVLEKTPRPIPMAETQNSAKPRRFARSAAR